MSENPFQQFVSQIASAIEGAKQFPLGKMAPLERPALADDAPNVLIFSPHPDDECIIGGVALRMMRELGMRVVNVAVTQGSNKERQQPRLEELQAACDYLGIDLVTTIPGGLERVNLKGQAEDPGWADSVACIADILKAHEPYAILFPHDDDWNSTHIGTNALLMDALRSLGEGFSTFCVETEFWGAMDDPNAMVELSESHVADLLGALSFHIGEISRNPYHLSAPSWMIDNVRRGGEIVGTQGGEAPDFGFATLYRVRKWENSGLNDLYEGGRNIGLTDPVSDLFA